MSETNTEPEIIENKILRDHLVSKREIHITISLKENGGLLFQKSYEVLTRFLEERSLVCTHIRHSLHNYMPIPCIKLLQ